MNLACRRNHAITFWKPQILKAPAVKTRPAIPRVIQVRGVRTMDLPVTQRCRQVVGVEPLVMIKPLDAQLPCELRVCASLMPSSKPHAVRSAPATRLMVHAPTTIHVGAHGRMWPNAGDQPLFWHLDSNVFRRPQSTALPRDLCWE